MYKLTLFIASFVFTANCLSLTTKQQAEYVNVFTGTTNSRSMINPGPALPQGMVKPGPDNQDQKWCGGYEYTIEYIDLNAFLSRDGELINELTNDGCHLQSVVYKPWSEAITKMLVEYEIN